MRKDIETRKEEVYTIISEIIAEQGMASVSTKSVAQKLGVSQPALYKYFKNRDEMLIGFLEYLTHLLTGILTHINQFETSEEKLQAFYNEQLALIEKTKILPKVLFFEEFHLKHTEKREKLHEMVEIYEEGIKRIITEGINRNEIINIDPQVAIQFIKGAILSAYLNWILAGMTYSLVDQQQGFMTFLRQTLLK